MTVLTAAEQILYATSRLVGFQGDKATSTGTGFYFNFNASDDDRTYPAIVTNKHVIKGCDKLLMKAHVSDGTGPSGQTIDLIIDLVHTIILPHSDDNVDLVAILIGRYMQAAEKQNTPLFLKMLNFEMIPDNDWEQFDAIEEVTMIGCPNGIFDGHNNLPIARRGNTATSLTKDYEGRHEFVVDIACFPGSSGSPIFIYDRNGFLDRKTNSYMIGQSRIKLVGILFAGPLINNEGKIVLARPPQLNVQTMMHLGYAIKSSQLFDILDQIKSRLAAENQL